MLSWNTSRPEYFSHLDPSSLSSSSLPPPSSSSAAWSSKPRLRACNRTQCRGTQKWRVVCLLWWRRGYYLDRTETGQVSNTGWVELLGFFVTLSCPIKFNSRMHRGDFSGRDCGIYFFSDISDIADWMLPLFRAIVGQILNHLFFFWYSIKIRLS